MAGPESEKNRTVVFSSCCRRRSTSVANIYQAFRPLAILTWIFGLFPVKNIYSGPYQSLNPVCCAYFIVVALTMIMFFMAGRGYFGFIYIPHDTTVIDQVFLMQSVNRVVHSLTQYFLLRCKSRRIADLFLRFHKYDEWVVTNNSVTKYSVNRLMHRRAWFLILFAFVYVGCLDAFYVVVLGKFTVNLFYHIGIFFILIFMCLIPIIPILHIIFWGKSIYFRLRQGNDTLLELLDSLPKNVMSSPHDEVIYTPEMYANKAKQLSFLMGLDAEMADLVNTTGELYGTCIVVSFLSSLIQIVAGVALILYEPESYDDIHNIADTLLSTIVVVWTCTCLQEIPKESMRVYPNLRRVSRLDIPTEIRLQVQEMTHFMTGPTVEISASNFFSVNRGLLTSIAASVITYLLVLAQFKSAEKEEEWNSDDYGTFASSAESSDFSNTSAGNLTYYNYTQY